MKLYASIQQRDELMKKKFAQHMSRYDGSIGDVMDIIVQFDQDQKDKSQVSTPDMFMSAWAIYLAGM